MGKQDFIAILFAVNGIIMFWGGLLFTLVTNGDLGLLVAALGIVSLIAGIINYRSKEPLKIKKLTKINK